MTDHEQRIRADWDNLFPGRFRVQLVKLSPGNHGERVAKPALTARRLSDLTRRAKRYGSLENGDGCINIGHYLFEPNRVSSITYTVETAEGRFWVEFLPEQERQP